MNRSVERPKMRAYLEIRDVGAESLVHDAAGGKVHVLNSSAVRVLRSCDGERDRAAIVRLLCDEHGAADDVIGPDVDGILRQFSELGLIADGAA